MRNASLLICGLVLASTGCQCGPGAACVQGITKAKLWSAGWREVPPESFPVSSVKTPQECWGKVGYSRWWDDFSHKAEAKAAAHKTYKVYQQTYGEKVGVHFKKGFIAGYVDICMGRCAVTPPIPPKNYWWACYRTPDGHTCARAWFNGYEVGMTAAQMDGHGCARVAAGPCTPPVVDEARGPHVDPRPRRPVNGPPAGWRGPPPGAYPPGSYPPTSPIPGRYGPGLAPPTNPPVESYENPAAELGLPPENLPDEFRQPPTRNPDAAPPSLEFPRLPSPGTNEPQGWYVPGGARPTGGTNELPVGHSAPTT